MKAGLEIGQSAEIDILVTKDMRTEFVGESVHDLYSTSDLCNQIEWAARKCLMPFLETTEESMVSHVEISHLALTVTGMNVRVKATVSEIRDKKIVCVVEAFNTRGKIARGTVTQSIIERTWLENKMKELSLINQLALQNFQVAAEQSKR
jgi:fluoroacetyl-CoA thioesterase